MARMFESSEFVHQKRTGHETRYKTVVTVPPMAEALAVRALNGTGVAAEFLGDLEVSSTEMGGCYLLSVGAYVEEGLANATKSLGIVLAMATTSPEIGGPLPKHLSGLDRAMERLVPGAVKLNPEP